MAWKIDFTPDVDSQTVGYCNAVYTFADGVTESFSVNGRVDIVKDKDAFMAKAQAALDAALEHQKGTAPHIAELETKLNAEAAKSVVLAEKLASIASVGGIK